MTMAEMNHTPTPDYMSDFVVLNQPVIDAQNMAESVGQIVSQMSSEELSAMHQEMLSIYTDLVEGLSHFHAADGSVFDDVGVVESHDNEKDRSSDANAALDKDAIQSYVTREEVMHTIESIREAASHNASLFQHNEELRELLNQALQTVNHAVEERVTHGSHAEDLLAVQQQDLGIAPGPESFMNQSVSFDAPPEDPESDSTAVHEGANNDAVATGTESHDAAAMPMEHLASGEGIEKFMGDFTPAQPEINDFKEEAKAFGVQQQSMMNRFDFDHTVSIRDQQDHSMDLSQLKAELHNRLDLGDLHQDTSIKDLKDAADAVVHPDVTDHADAAAHLEVTSRADVLSHADLSVPVESLSHLDVAAHADVATSTDMEAHGLTGDEGILGGDDLAPVGSDMVHGTSEGALSVYDTMHDQFDQLTPQGVADDPASALVSGSHEHIAEWVTGDTGTDNAAIMPAEEHAHTPEVHDAISMATDHTSQSHQPTGAEGLV